MGGRGGAGGGLGAGEAGRGRGMSLAKFLSQQDINRANAALLQTWVTSSSVHSSGTQRRSAA